MLALPRSTNPPVPNVFVFASSSADLAWPPGRSLASATMKCGMDPPATRMQKRRLDIDIGDGIMESSPLPDTVQAERSLKRARVTDGVTREQEGCEDDVDVGVLLARLPSESLLILLKSLIREKPSLKSIILPLIPRPTLEVAIEALAQSAKKLRDAYPFENINPGSLPSCPDRDIGCGEGTMRTSYITSRLRPHVQEFVSASTSYLPYFSSTSNQSLIPSTSASFPHTQPMQSVHPTETFSFLAALTNHCLAQPPITRSSLAYSLFPRLQLEWKAWVESVDEVVNRRGGMFGTEVIKSWESTLDDLAGCRGPEGYGLRDVRDLWVLKVGWLVGRVQEQYV